MKKCTCLTIFEKKDNKYVLKEITIKHKNENIVLYFYDGYYITELKEYTCFSKMYLTVLKILKNNNYYVYSWEENNIKWYDIDFFNITDMILDRYPYFPLNK